MKHWNFISLALDGTMHSAENKKSNDRPTPKACMEFDRNTLSYLLLLDSGKDPS
jgi:hypothetical protein